MKRIDSPDAGFVDLPSSTPFCAELKKNQILPLCGGLASCTPWERTCFGIAARHGHNMLIFQPYYPVPSPFWEQDGCRQDN